MTWNLFKNRRHLSDATLAEWAMLGSMRTLEGTVRSWLVWALRRVRPSRSLPGVAVSL